MLNLKIEPYENVLFQKGNTIVGESQLPNSMDSDNDTNLHYRKTIQFDNTDLNSDDDDGKKKESYSVYEAGILSTATDEDGIPSATHPMEKQILKKMDMFLIPLMCLLYFLSNLDKSNIGNAEIAGLSKSLNLKGREYNTCVTVFYGSYIVFDPIGTNLLKIIGPKYLMTICLLSFGLISLCTAWCKSFGGLVAVRVLLGCMEGIIYPAINMYLSVCYRREQYAKRFAYVFSAACLSSSFGGLISYGCSKIKGSHLAAWQYIFIVEGAISIGCTPLYFFGMAKDLENSWFFNKEEKEYVMERYKTMNTFNPEEKFDWEQVWFAIKDIKTWVSAVALFGIDLTTFGLTVFLPIIITSLGFTNVRAQLMTVPVYFLTAIVFFICANLSDRLKLRSPFIVGACLTTIIGLAIVLGSQIHGVRYFGVYILCMGIYVNAAVNCLWLSGNVGNYFKRATALGINLFLGSGSGLVAGQIFFAKEKPRYITGLSICLAFQVLSIIMTLLQLFLYMWENKKKDAITKRCNETGEPIPYDDKLSDKNPQFKYMY
ncbi:hypothetical protein TBLA_0C06700 [Henningerozyma blattae CBS 6284]|uniref:Major facilitator superfamily (MFS) profile domain-containing protein n=1 Tax=Henningerozyma blattae (strain ATCC 34711 / CBS 6284 / DSM 70876 / NBRC 10599 / NRRL Y-10934 / UCD 77-7) TaxID=1071380 RepID=I2H260_HENB6|nr:hypothetical protein TBLA_0C06700 [Tetrapisispora blattae CBS 6284]CCH60462.1 hypothetical protein TBLA_0C06700 [Tetrapisispora blattae CBS 6284]